MKVNITKATTAKGFFSIAAVSAAVALAGAASAAGRVSLDGVWEFDFRRGGTLAEARADFAATDRMTVPGCFDVMPRHYNQRGLAHYRREFLLDRPCRQARLRVKGFGLAARFFVDGRDAGESHLAFSTVEVPLGPLAAGRHVVVVALDNRITGAPDALFQPHYDFYGSGGLYHGVDLETFELESEIDRVFVRTLDYRTGRVSLELAFSGPAPEGRELAASVAFDDGEPKGVVFVGGRAEATVPDFRTWSPKSPNLHRVTVSAEGFGRKSERFGIREVRTEGRKILLNGEEVYLLGVNRHESHPEFGYATSRPLMMEDVQLMKGLGCNYVRGAHYPQTEDFLDLCDEAGLMVWEESLGWGNWEANCTNGVFVARQVEQTRLMVRNSFNHPSVVLFGFLNECGSCTPSGRDLVRLLCETVRAERSGRLVTWACNQVMNGDLGNEFTDVMAYNAYPGWINEPDPVDREALDRACREATADNVGVLRKRFGDKPIIVAEMGTCGVYGARDRGGAQWTEDFEAEWLDAAIRAVFANREVTGFTVWQFADARSYFRGGSNIRTKPFAMNLAGLFDGYRREKLAACAVRRLFIEKARGGR